MITLAYFALGVTTVLFVIAFVGMILAGIIDWHYKRKNAVWSELQRTNYERRRPAAK